MVSPAVVKVQQKKMKTASTMKASKTTGKRKKKAEEGSEKKHSYSDHVVAETHDEIHSLKDALKDSKVLGMSHFEV